LVTLLGGALASVLAAAIYFYGWLRVWGRARVPLYRHLFSTATVVLAIHAAAAVVARFGVVTPFDAPSPVGLLIIVLALLAYTVVNTCLVVGAIVLSARRSVIDVLGSGDEVILEIATLSLGGITATVLAVGNPIVVLVLPSILVLHRVVLVRQLEVAASTDSKTSALTAAAWQLRATKQLKRAVQRDETAALLMIDIDHFKRVNDVHGHLVGDQVLAAVAKAIASTLGPRDLLGRFGGEEFVALLVESDLDRDHLRRIGNEVRRAVRQVAVEYETPDGPLTVTGVSVSIGGALFPTDGRTTEALIHVADGALYAVKGAGRDGVRIGQSHPDEGPLPEQRRDG
jgi:diguanylate cyclase (GGDEF)-like protein